MHEMAIKMAEASTGLAAKPPPSAGGLASRLRFGIGRRLAFGLMAVAVVILVGHGIAARTTRAAVNAVRNMQQEHEPVARRASAVMQQLVAYDRAVGEYLQGIPAAESNDIGAAADALGAAVQSYFEGPPVPDLTEAIQLRAQLASHVDHGRELVTSASQRAHWMEERRAALGRIQQRIVSAGGTGLPINGTQVVARRSLADLASAMSVLRGDLATGGLAAKHEQLFAQALSTHAAELQHSPGRNWLSMIRDDFHEAVHLRQAVERFDTANGSARREFLEESAALTAGVQSYLQEPARLGLVHSAARAATAAEGAEHTLTMTGAAVIVVLILVSVLLILSISVPVRRLTRATRALAGGDRAARVPRGGSAEIDVLADAFNTMADQVTRAESALRAYQSELEHRVAERTEQLHHLAHHDPLTQLPNRRQLSTRLAEALTRATATGRRAALLFVDIDNFKSINDTLGHNFGDHVLQAIADRLRVTAGPQALLARLGGDEFTVLLENVDCVAAVERRAAEIVTRLQEPVAVDGRVLATSASVGASLFPDHAQDPQDLLRAADVALFQAKESGRNRFALYSPALNDAAAQRFRTEQALRAALEAGDLVLAFQPQVALHTRETTSVEALLRWRKPDGRIAAAGEFIQSAEQSGLIHELTEWVLRSATSTAAAWRAQGWHRVCVAINVSPRQFFERDFVDHIARALHATGLPASALELELTETVLQTGHTTIQSLRRLRDMGVSIALDDFGIGYSSLTSLEKLPINRVKLDRMLVEGVDSNPRSAAIVRSIVALCHGLGLQVTAEGVERPAQLEFLAGCGPVAVQGYLLAQAVEVDLVQQEARNASERARRWLDDELLAEGETSGSSLVFVGAGGRRRTTAS